MLRRLLPCLFVLTPAVAIGQAAPFDLRGPDLSVAVTHKGATLPIAAVPNLEAGDRVDVSAVLPPDQEAHYLLIAAFLRGATNPPPRDWFAQAATWKKGKNKLDLTVPQGAERLILFLVPETGGAYGAVVKAVRGQPGTFVRAVQDLSQAALDRARLDAFLRVVQRDGGLAPDAIPAALTASLGVRVNTQCLQLQPELQAACMTRSGDSVVMTDGGRRDSIVEKITGAPVDLAIQVSNTPAGGYGYYSPYLAVLRDLGRLLGAFQSTQLRYVPTLAQLDGDRMGLLLNAAPSFRSPRSVLVAAMPPVGEPAPPVIRAREPDRAYCATRPGAALPVDADPLVYATGHAHDLALRFAAPGGKAVAAPVRPDAEQGALVLTAPVAADAITGEVEASLGGMWGFTPISGPRFRLQSPNGRTWRAGGEEATTLVVGRDNQFELTGGAASCVRSVEIEDAGGATRPLEWKVAANDRVAVTLPLARAKPGSVTLVVREYGRDGPVKLVIKALTEASRLDGFTLHAGDATVTITGTRLDLVENVTVDGLAFKPGAVSREGQADRLTLTAADPAAARALAVGDERTARVSLSDGRRLALRFTVAPTRPAVALIARSVARPAPAGAVRMSFLDEDAVPQDGRLTFSIRAQDPLRFTGAETVELATTNGAIGSVKAGSGLTLQDDHVAVVSVEPGKLLGPSAYGPLRFRLVRDGVQGEWMPLGKLVRLPELTGLACAGPGKPCALRGDKLFLLAAAAPDRRFANAVAVPDGFTGSELAIPADRDRTIYLRLRDDPEVVAIATAG